MKEFIKQFTRDPDGAWRCIGPATLETDSGRIQVTAGSRFAPGTVFMGVDVAAWLDTQASLQRNQGKGSAPAESRP
jgi:hypothetical protein